MKWTLALLLLVAAAVAAAGASEKTTAAKGPKSSVVKRALLKRDRAIEQAEAAYRRAVEGANKALLGELTKAKEAALTAKDLDEANAVAGLMARTEKELKGPPAGASAIAGTWLIGWHGGPYPYRFSGDGTELGNETHKSVRSERSGTTWTFSFDNNHVHRFRLAGEYLVGEAWYSLEAFARGDEPEQVAIGRREK